MDLQKSEYSESRPDGTLPSASHSSGDEAAEETPVPVLIVGAGPYGVAIACELHHLGVPFLIFGEPFQLWLQHTLSDADLRSDTRTSEIFSRDDRFGLLEYVERNHGVAEARRLERKRVSVKLYREYLEEVLRRLPFPIQREKISSLDSSTPWEGGGFLARSRAGRSIRAQQVVIACGVEPHRYLPEELRSLPEGKLLHGWQAAEVERLEGERVLVIGGGQTAGEAIRTLRARNQVTWAHRQPPVFFADPIHVPAPVFKGALKASGFFRFLPGPVRGRIGRFFVGTTMTPDLEQDVYAADVESIECDARELGLVAAGGVIHSNRLGGDYDRVVACTGYRLGVSNLSFIRSELREAIRRQGDVPLLDRHFETSVSGLYLVGAIAEPKHGPAQRFVIGSRNAALTVGAEIARRLRRQPDPAVALSS